MSARLGVTVWPAWRAFRRTALVLGAFMACPTLYASPALSQAAYPARVVKFIVASAPGGGTDTVARILAQHLSTTMGQQFIVENRAGAGNVIGTEAAARATPDGYTLLVSASTLTTTQAMGRKLSYDVLRDFAPISMLVQLPNVLVVGPEQKFKTFEDFVSAARAAPDSLSYGSAGLGTQPHLAMVMLQGDAGLKLLHVPYSGVAPALVDIMGGRVTGMFVNLLSAKPQIDGGTLRALAVSSTSRSTFLPDTPTIAESGLKDFEAIQWFGLLAPAGTPEPIIKRLHAEVRAWLASADVRQRLAAEGAEPVGNSPDEFKAALGAELTKWGAVAKAAGLKD
jgi:tripartite-type tricarboxylate transporter receptor subunit TctC